MHDARERLCHRCGHDIGPTVSVGRRDPCLRCGTDLHCCLNCDFYDPGYHNQCREPHSEPQGDKGAGNFCDFFRFRRGARAGTSANVPARAQLDALFKKSR